MKKTTEKNNTFPISSIRRVKGSRRFVREKVLQILVSHFVSGSDINELIDNIFYRDYKIDSDNEVTETAPKEKTNKILTEEELEELEADAGIDWREEDIKLAHTIINGALAENDFVIEKLKEISKHWRYERISIIDRVLILMAVSEILHCPEIPIKVSINEVVDIAKIYSTDKSTQFINGILDTILTFLMNENKVNKTGRGLK